MFGIPKKSVDTPALADPETNSVQSGKGRPTPSRKEAEAARKTTIRAKGGTKEGKKASREADRSERARQRQGMLAGDPRFLPARDQGPVRAFVRDFVDGRFTVAEYFIFMAVVVLLLGFINNPSIQQLVSVGFFLMAALIVVDTSILIIQLSISTKKAFPEKSDRRGIILYALMRTLQYRRLRMPKPRVQRGRKKGQ
jgi:hypothetical protein